MQLIFKNFFRPRWQHPKPGIRRQAVSRLKPDVDADQHILQQMAKLDQDIEVRCSALDKLTHPALLKEIATTDPTPEVRGEAIRRFCQLICQPGPQNLSAASRREQLQQLDDPDILTHIALNADSPEIQLAATERIRQESSLQQIVKNSDNFQLRKLAAGGISSPERISQLLKHCRQRDKSVYRILRERLDQQKKSAKRLAQQQQTCETLCNSLEKLLKEPPNNHYRARLQALLQQWHELGEAARQPFQQRFETVQQQCAAQLQTFESAQQEARKVEHNQQQREQILRAFDDQLQQLTASPQLLLAELDQRFSHFDPQWAALELAADEGQQQRFERCQQALQELVQGASRLQQQQARIDDLLNGDATEAELQQLLEIINWPATLQPPEPLQAILHRMESLQIQRRQQSEQQRQLQQALDQQLKQLESALTEGQLQQAAELLKQLKPNKRAAQGRLSAAQQQRFQRLNARFQELNNWQLFATHPKLEQLCLEMEQLVEAELAVTDRAARIKALQQRWKQLETPTMPPDLRNRFQQANQLAYAPCRVHYQQQRQQRQENLQQRQLLLQQLQQAFEDSGDDSAACKLLSARSREIRQQWREFSPVERTEGKKLQQQFNRLLSDVDKRLTADQQRNADTKQQLLDQARALLDAEDPAQARNSAKQLQQRWKATGPAKRQLEQQLWEQFRAACNQLFERPEPELPDKGSRGEAPSANRAAEPVAIDPDWQPLERRHQLCEALEMALLMDGQLTVDEQHLAAWQQGDYPQQRFADKLQQRFEQLLQLQDNPQQAEAMLDEAERQLRLLCIRLEVVAGSSSPEEDHLLRMEYQISHLKQALEQHRSEPCENTIQALEKLWLCVPFNQCFASLRQRFEGQLQALLTP